MEVFNVYHIEAARRLPNLPASHPCANLHGHSFRLEIFVNGPIHPDTGWVMDFADLDTAFAPIKARLDHRYLNEIPGLENPTSERLAQWIWQQLKAGLPGLSKIVIQETHQSGCVYSGD
ncbi:MAG: 6-carboxytetrahydropterin synthase QueD [Thiobacillaceae bacterium]|jgi:6-pyruvoyltetrahydropterin/6-carboxytetrahydropterin synthase